MNHDASRGRAHTWIRNHVLGLVAIMIALGGTAVAADDNGSGASAAAKGNTAKQVKKLNKTVKNLKNRVAALESQPNPAIPTTLPPSGPAGGSLTGDYPNPAIANDAVGAAQIANGSVGQDEIGNSAVGAPELKSINADDTDTQAVAAGATGQAIAVCDPGEILVSGGAFWSANNAGLAIHNSFALFNAWIVRGSNNSAVQRNITAQALCLVP